MKEKLTLENMLEVEVKCDLIIPHQHIQPSDLHQTGLVHG
jgi:hypothetical protein